MAKLLFLVATGPENTTRASLALLVARAAMDEGHDVRLFLAGDAVGYARPATAATAHGVGTGSFGEHWEALASGGVPITLSGMSCNARGIDQDSVPEGVRMAKPPELVEQILWADKTVTL